MTSKKQKLLEDQEGLKKHQNDNVPFQLDDNKESEVSVSEMSGVDERENQKRLVEFLHNLKPKLKELCEILKLPENVKNLADSLSDQNGVLVLRYLENYRQFDGESSSLAFLISLCWFAASFLKYELDHKESIALATQHLKFQCQEEHADYGYFLWQYLTQSFTSDHQNVYNLNASSSSSKSPAELVANQVEHSHQADAQHTDEQAFEFPRPGSERHVSVTMSTPIPPPTKTYLCQDTPSVQMYPQPSQRQAILRYEREIQWLIDDVKKKIGKLRTEYNAKVKKIASEFHKKKKKPDANLTKTFRFTDARYPTPQRTQTGSSSSPPQHYMQQLAARNTAPRHPVYGGPPQLSFMSPGNFGRANRAPMQHLLPPLRPLAQSAAVGIPYSIRPMPDQWAYEIPPETFPLFALLPPPQGPRPSINPSGSLKRAHQPEAARVLQSTSSLSPFDRRFMEFDNPGNAARVLQSTSSLSPFDRRFMEFDNPGNSSGNPPSNSQQQMEVASNSEPLAPLQNAARRDPMSPGEVFYVSDDD